ncbi:CIC_collapsed_G0032290.mRNA.1.CDS.1 [Saccharomyces cerevisiae]|nr:CIC_collapsed_G0032290.mRNA.1.CDS.1 [Saccharomyces cerevisiae]
MPVPMRLPTPALMPTTTASTNVRTSTLPLPASTSGLVLLPLKVPKITTTASINVRTSATTTKVPTPSTIIDYHCQHQRQD